MLFGILNCADAAIAKTEQLAADVKKYQTDKIEREAAGIVNTETVSPIELARVVEPEFQYGAEAFEIYQQQVERTAIKDKTEKKLLKK